MDKKDRIKFLLDKAKFKLTKKERIMFQKDLKLFRKDLKTLENFDLSNIEIAKFPFEVTEPELRDDNFISNNHYGILENSSNVKGEYLFLKSIDKKEKDN